MDQSIKGAHRSSSPEETHTLGREVASRLDRGDTVGFFGNLGSGKTCMIQGICAGLNVSGGATSPSFVLMNEYEGLDSGGKPLPVFHFDLYRLQQETEVEDLGWDDYVGDEGICLIEWADRAGEMLPAKAIRICLEVVGDTLRDILIE